MDTTLIYSVVTLGIIGTLFGVMLEFASQVFHVEEDERVVAVNEALPGVNCGACGYPGCAGLADAIVAGKAPVNACPVGGEGVATAIGEIMGQVAGDMEKEVARVLCGGNCETAKSKFEFIGIEDCRSMDMYYHGNKVCEYGCLGGGTCAKLCQFDAITMENGLPIIDKDKCTACNICVANCPKDIIKLVPYSAETVIECNSLGNAREVRPACTVGCIGCRMCVRNCPVEAIGFENNLAVIDYSKCTQCGICVEKCPTKCIKAEYEIELPKEA